MTLSTSSSIQDIAARFNELNGSDIDPKNLAKRGKAKLLARIEELEEAAAAIEAARLAEEAAKVAVPVVVKKGRAPKAAKVAKVKGPVIRHLAEALLLEVMTYDDDGRPYGHGYDYILGRIFEAFEGAKTSVACLRWYAVHMRERGEKVPNRPRATPKAK